MARGPRPKIVRVMEEYDLEGLGEELEQRWTDPENGASLRELARDVNIRMLERAIEATESTPLEGEAANLYRLLTDDDVSRGTRTEARDRLQRRGIDVEELTTDFVSRQALHNYLTSHRNVSPPDTSSTDENPRETRLGTIQRLRNRLETVTRSVLSELSSAGDLTLGDATVHVSVRVHCSDCGARVPVDTLLETGSCDCDSSTE